MPPPNVNWVEVSKKCSFLIRSQVSGPDNISLSPLLGPSSFDSIGRGTQPFLVGKICFERSSHAVSQPAVFDCHFVQGLFF